MMEAMPGLLRLADLGMQSDDWRYGLSEFDWPQP
jgi:hypothetical protein